MVTSDHGMQENGNHGGSSYEETDSLALFIGPRSSHASATYDTINQVLVCISLFKVQNCCYISHNIVLKLIFSQISFRLILLQH